ncbi:hypothetical protein BVC80_8967g26 [Macleaya cordata]|uniref:Uncharacterized protein n=1 Tax=Macleaya cordata TaxID=56857 RepID=A0A200PLY7_MACCD|nr:hypothetical protein BVC80_8967g26 [Macleaya cordata]
MARTFSRTLIQSYSSLPSKKIPPFVPTRIVNHRNRSNQAEKGNLIEVDLEQETEVEVLGMRRLEDAIHGIIVRRSAPDWLPFIPGSSYWVPPRKRPHGLVELMGKLANPLTEEENLSLSTVRGWPSSSYFFDGNVPMRFDY